MTRLLLTLAFLVPVFRVSAYAHHSFSTHYFEDQTVSIEGELVQFEYRNPHAWVHVMAKDANGQVQRFAAEWCSPIRLTRDGIAGDTLKPGDYVILTGSPGRNLAEHKLHLKGLERPADGLKAGTARRPGTQFPCY